MLYLLFTQIISGVSGNPLHNCRIPLNIFNILRFGVGILTENISEVIHCHT